MADTWEVEEPAEESGGLWDDITSGLSAVYDDASRYFFSGAADQPSVDQEFQLAASSAGANAADMEANAPGGMFTADNALMVAPWVVAAGLGLYLIMKR